MRGATGQIPIIGEGLNISTPAPLAGRDVVGGQFVLKSPLISTHAPLAGRDRRGVPFLAPVIISTHAPLAGRDE